MSVEDMISLVHDKVRGITELAAIAGAARADGRSVVLCHGVFDLLHLGHVRHIEAARRQGDLLIVTITADAFVNKGPGRPVFGERQRAEMIAALGYVDYVGINHAATAEPVIEKVRPTLYVKGGDYENVSDDVTGNIARERDSVEQFGGKVIFTNDITFSSSSLINRYLDVYDPPLRNLLSRMRESDALAELFALIERVKDMRVLLIGDAIVDEYQYIAAMGKAPKENMIATRFLSKELFAGGVFAAANHVASFCKDVEIISVLGEADSHEEMIRSHLKPNVRFNALYRPGVPTTRKCRFVEPDQLRKIFEVYFMDDLPLEGDLLARLQQTIRERAGDFDLVIVTDFGHGMLNRSTAGVIADHARFLAVNAQSNSANLGYNQVTKYPRADYICIDTPEARLAIGDKFADVETIASDMLCKAMACPKAIITHGEHGCVTFEEGKGTVTIPAFTKRPIDTVGAGDAFLAVTSPLVAAGGRMDLVGFVGNAAGAMKVNIVGHRASVEKAGLLKFVTALLK